MTSGRVEDGRRFTALVLAGSRGNDDPVARHCGVPYKCLAPAGGVPMLARVIEALAAAPGVGRILVSHPDPAMLEQLPALRPLRAAGRCLPSAGRPTPSESVLAALGEMPSALPMLVTTADHALLTPEMIVRFVRAADATGADLVVGLTSAAVIKAAYPEARRTYLRFRDARYSGANLFAILTPAGARAVAFWRRVEQERKRPWRIVQAFGPGPLLGYLLNLWTLEAALARASTIIGATVAAVRLPYAEAAIDVDKPADLALVEAILTERGSRADIGPVGADEARAPRLAARLPPSG